MMRFIRSLHHSSILFNRPVDMTDLLIVGAGPAGLSAAIKAKQLNKDLRVVVVEKAAEVGLHTLSGAVIEPRALDELLPNWRELNAPIYTKATNDKMLFLTKNDGYVLPNPPDMHNEGNFIVSLSQVVKWLGTIAEELGVEIYSGISASNLVIKNNKVLGIATSEVGLDKQFNKTAQYDPGMILLSPITLLAEGCHGSLSKQLINHFNLRKNSEPQTYGIGLKEVWEIDPNKHENGLIVHSVGWPLDYKTYGGSFLYHFTDENNRKLVSTGYVVGLDYWNPNTNPYKTFQQYKTHPLIRQYLQGGQCISYGARALNEGGWQSLPKLTVDGCALIGCSAGFLNLPKIKGTHLAMKSGMLAAESVVAAKTTAATPVIEMESDIQPFPVLNLLAYEENVKYKSWVGKELYQVRNSRPGFHYGLYAGLVYNGLDLFLTRGKTPWTFSHNSKGDYASLMPWKDAPAIEYPKPDGVVSFALLDNLARSGTNHNHVQPSHLRLNNNEIQCMVNKEVYGGPEANFCPAGVYEYLETTPYRLSNGKETKWKFQINSQNCVHCKTCDIKDPSQNINWTVPEGGGGPAYNLT